MCDTVHVSSNLAFADGRRETREEVHFHARAFDGDGQPVTLLVVNLSQHGLMARCNEDHSVGERMRIMLPQLGTVASEVRWALGGRVGIQFDRALEPASYYILLSTALKA